MSEPIEFQILTGRDADLSGRLAELANLRIEVFRDFPYLYDGDLAYEMNYVRTYLESPATIVVFATAAGKIVGASSGVPLADETDELKAPFIHAGLDPRRIFYCGESVLLPAYRGRGVYREFFAAREMHARARTGLDRIVFCGVERPADHPLKPPGYVPLDAVWQRFGYSKRADLVAHFAWKDIDADESSSKPMVFWEKML